MRILLKHSFTLHLKSLQEKLKEVNLKLPKGEKVRVNYIENYVTKYICTSKETDRGLYFLYRVDGEKLEKISKSVNPMDFDKIVYNTP